jgi:Zn-dependent protease with chaperone function
MKCRVCLLVLALLISLVLPAKSFGQSVRHDAETVIAALKHVHELNGSPLKLRPADEAIASHPSLENRIKAIRRLSQH